MNAEPVVIAGIVRDDGTLELEGKIPLPAGRVNVTLQPVSGAQRADEFLAFVEGIRARRAQAGFPTRSREEIDNDMEQIRNEFEERVQGIGQLQDECRRQRLEAEAEGKEGQG